ncbi:MAG: hypothetical protein CML55_06265 [Rhodobacteraceae bacterium]|nr:hypothetical protein [Paracoccaceae bacterium]MBO28287.1 hypothetical protein [Paracoccaceae bacterium]
MTNPALSDTLYELAQRLCSEIALVCDTLPTTAPAQQARVAAWLERCAARDATAGTEEALAAVLRDLVTMRNGQLGFTGLDVRSGARPEAMIAADLGGAVPLGQAVVALLRDVAACDPDLALRLIREVRTTDQRQQAEIARAIGGR